MTQLVALFFLGFLSPVFAAFFGYWLGVRSSHETSATLVLLLLFVVFVLSSLWVRKRTVPWKPRWVALLAFVPGGASVVTAVMFAGELSAVREVIALGVCSGFFLGGAGMVIACRERCYSYQGLSAAALGAALAWRMMQGEMDDVVSVALFSGCAALTLIAAIGQLDELAFSCSLLLAPSSIVVFAVWRQENGVTAALSSLLVCSAGMLVPLASAKSVIAGAVQIGSSSDTRARG